MGAYLVMRNNFKRSLRHGLVFAVTLILPVILGLAAGMLDIKSPSVRVGILTDVNTDKQDGIQGEIYKVFKASEGIKVAAADETALHADLISGRFAAVLDYRGSTGILDFNLLTNQKDSKKADLDTTLRAALSIGQGINFTGFTQNTVTVTERTLAILLTLFIIFSTVHTSAIILDRQNVTLTRYRFTGGRKGGYALGYITYNFVITFVSISVCLLLLMLCNKNVTISAAAAAVLALIITAIAVCLATAISLLSKSELQAGVTASSLAAVLSLLGGAFVAVEHMPKLLQLLSYASPVRWIIELTRVLG